MPRKPKLHPDDPEQFKRFTDLAREVGAGKQGKDFERVFDKIATTPPGQDQSRDPHQRKKQPRR